MVIKTREISKSFGENSVLKDINLSINKGEIFGLLGPSGAGKTTLIKILTGQLVASSGEAYVFGRNVKKLNREAYTGIGAVYDGSGLYDRLSCYDNLYIFSKIYGITKSKIYEVLERVGLADSVKKPVSKLSTGMRQRLVIARAIMHSPKLLFLDEPTTGLDPVSTNMVHDIILEFKKNDTAVFMTTHNMTEAAKLCDNIGLLHLGKIIEYGAPAEICYKYNKDKKVQVISKIGSEIIPYKNLSEYLQSTDMSQIEAIHSMEPNLEDVFLELTGRKLV